MNNKKITILGSGGIGLVTAVDLLSRGYEVRLFELPEFKKNIDPIIEKGGIDYTGVKGSGFVELNMITTDAGQALKDVNLIMLCAPAFAHMEFFKACIPFLQNGQIFLIETGYFGSLRFSKAIKNSGKKITIIEMNITPYCCSREGSNKIFIHQSRKEVYIAALPAKNTIKVYDFIKGIYKGTIIAKNILQTSLDNANWVMHAPFALPFRGLFESKKDFVFPVKDSVVPAVDRLTEAMESEQLKLGKAYGLDIPPLKHIFEPAETYEESLRKSPEFETWKLRYKSGQNKYLKEDLYYAFPPLISLANLANVPIPTIM